MKTLDEIKDEVATKLHKESNKLLHEEARILLIDKYVTEVCKSYAKECCIATLEKASENARITSYIRPGFDVEEGGMEINEIDKSSITNPDNIVL